MYYKREEAFRYQFDTPLPCSYKIVEIDNKTIDSGFGDGEVIDLSAHGLKLSSNLNIPFQNHEVKIEITFKINFSVIDAVGRLIWRKEKTQSTYQYGIEFINLSEMYEIITTELKKYVKSKNDTEKG